MTSIAAYTPIPNSETNPTRAWVNWVDTVIEAGLVTHDDIPVFTFRPLDEIRNSLQQEGYSAEEIESTITGLSQLPEYASQGNADEASGR